MVAPTNETKRLYEARMRKRYPSRPLSIERRYNLQQQVRELVEAATNRGQKLSRIDLCKQLELGYAQVIAHCMPMANLPVQHAAVDTLVKRAVLWYASSVNSAASAYEIANYFNRKPKPLKMYYGKVRRILEEAKKNSDIAVVNNNNIEDEQIIVVD